MSDYGIGLAGQGAGLYLAKRGIAKSKRAARAAERTNKRLIALAKRGLAYSTITEKRPVKHYSRRKRG